MSAEPSTAGQSPDRSGHSLAITEHAPLPMVTVEGATRLVRYGNPAFCRMIGQPLEAIVGKPFDELLPEKDQCVTLIERVFRTKRPESFTEHEPGKPHPVFWSYTIWPVTDEALVGVMIQVTETAAAHDQTIAMNEALLLGSLRQHELTATAEKLNEQLRASEGLFSSLVEQAPFGTYVVDAQFRVQQVNRLAMPVFATVRPLIGRDFSEVIQILWGPEVGGKVAEIFRRTLKTGERYLSPPFTEQRQDIGTVQSYEWETQRVTLPGGEHAVVCYFTDISERRALEDSLVERAAELARADRSKDEFLAMLAHELRNPLAPLRNAAEILRTPGADAAERAEAHAIVARQIENMTHMLDDLLDVSRITAGKIELRREPVALAEILNAAAHVARPGIAERSQELAVSLPAEPIFLNADSTRLEQVFGNLLTNACKYSYTGSHITLSAERTGGAGPPEVIVRVSDDGMGIAPELLPHIFDLFVQSTRSLDREHGGLGIGLTLVRRLVQLHGGSVEARSEGLTMGSEFTVRLPILAAPVAVPSPRAPAARETPRRILIVDDNKDSVSSHAMLQKRRGHTVRTAFTGPDAVTAAAEFLPEVVLLDIGLPGMDGYEVARRLRAMPALAGALIVAMSGYGSDEDRATAKLAGFDEYMVKPMDLDRLRELLRGRE